MKALSLGKVVEFVYNNHPHAREWEPELLAGWVAAFIREEFIICVSKDGKEIDGIVMFRPVMHPEDGLNDNYHFDPEGACVFLDFTVGTPEMREGLILAVIERVGRRPLVAWERRGTLRIYDIERFLRHNLRKEKRHYGR